LQVTHRALGLFLRDSTGFGRMFTERFLQIFGILERFFEHRLHVGARVIDRRGYGFLHLAGLR